MGLFVLLILFGSAVTLLLVLESKRISSAGGWGYLMGFFVFAVGAFFLRVAVVTGITITAVSTPLYRRASSRALYWYSPLSVYTAIAIYGLAIFVLRHFIDDFDANQTRWAVGLQAILGMWWGVTMLLPLTVAVQVLAHVNHRVLRRILTTT